MSRKSTGQVIEVRGKRGRSFAVRFRAYGRRHYLTLGSVEDGWTRQRAEVELQNILADVRRGIWQPPEPEPAAVQPPRIPTFHEFASQWFEVKRRELRPNTVAAYEWEITHHLLPFFATHRLDRITVEEVDRYKNAKVRERDAIREAIERGEDPTRRPLSNESINKTLTRLAQILEVAVEYGHLDRNPGAGKRRRLKVSRPHRSYLDAAEQIVALLDAAAELDRKARPRRGQNRRAILATFVLAGLRISELVALRWRDVDLAAGRLRVGQAKTDAGVREVELLPALRDELAALKAGSDATADALVFGTTNGRPQSPTNIRRRVLARAVTEANERLDAKGLAPLPEGLTPHSLRRTFASVLYALGQSPPVVMAELGHTDPKLALRIYARAMRRDAGAVEKLRALAEGDPVVTGDQLDRAATSRVAS